MKTTKWKSYILLDDAGMLSARRKKALEKSIHADPNLRAYRDQLQQIRRAIRTDEHEAIVSDFTLERINTEAAKYLSRKTASRRSVFSYSFVTYWRPAVVYGGLSVLLLMGGLLLLRYPAEEMTPYAERMSEDEPAVILEDEWDIRFEAAMLELEVTLDQLETELDEPAGLSDEDGVEELARELLQLEGT